LGHQGSAVRLMDPPGKTQQMTFPELLAVMDGLGIAVTAGPSSAIELRAGGWLAALAGLVGIIATIALTRKLVPSLSTKPWAGPAWIVVVGIAGATFYHTSSASGFLRAPEAVGEVSRRYF